MSGLTDPTVLEKWKQLAEIENRRARATWGSIGGWYQRPESFENPEIIAARRAGRDLRHPHLAGAATGGGSAEGMTVDELRKWERTRPDASKITSEEHQLIDDAVAGGRVTRVPTGASAFNREYVWAAGYRGSMKLKPVGAAPERKPGYAWRRGVNADRCDHERGCNMKLGRGYHDTMHERIYRHAPTPAKAHHTWAVLSAICSNLCWKTCECAKTVAQLCDLTLTRQDDMNDILGLLEQVGAIRRTERGGVGAVRVTPEGT